MVETSRSASGVLGLAGRLPARTPTELTSGFRLAGHALPLISPVRMYICGITPYDVTHLGHAATFVWADAAAAVARLCGAKVITCRNVTDIDDVLMQTAAIRQRYYDEYALVQESIFEQDMSALRVRRPAHEPRSRYYVDHVVQLAGALMARGRAYERDGRVYFRGDAVPAMAGIDRGDALRLAADYGDQPTDPQRDDPFDVAVWRPSSPSDPAWPSPWGWGRPGWHAECAAMAIAVLGTSIDVVAGGADLAFPHHAYQAAMVEAATGITPFTRGRLPVGTVHRDGVKIAKSTGNLVLVGDMLREYSPAAVRLLLLDRPWAANWDYRPAHLAAAADRLDRLYSTAATPAATTSATTAMTRLLADNLDVPAALDLAEDAGGETARLLLRTLGLD